MRIALLVFLLLVLSPTGNAQPYKSMFGQNSTTWVFTWLQAWGLSVDTVFAGNDTLVNGLTYKKLIVSTALPFEVGLIREDTLSGKVWYKSMQYISKPDDTDEVLAYNFSLQKGDSFDTWNINYGTSKVIDDTLKIVDSVYYADGLKHIRFKSKGGTGIYAEPLVFIEGIGCNYGILWKELNTALFFHYLLCSYKEGIKTPYSNILYSGDCLGFLGVNKAIIAKEVVDIYPIPADKELFIKNNSTANKIIRIDISNISGVIIKSYEGDYNHINLTDFYAGIYTVKILFENKNASFRNITIRH